MAENWKTFVGHMSDRELSRRFGVSASTVRRYRTQQRITPHNPQIAEMPEGLMDKLATSTDYKLMTEFGISVSRVYPSGQLTFRTPALRTMVSAYF